MNQKNGKVYVVCPANAKSGGVDALHQLVFYLNQQQVNASIVYRCNRRDKRTVEILDRYKPYIGSFLLEKDIIDSPQNIVVLTESFTKDRFRFKHVKIFIWWLGINDSLTYGSLKKIFFLLTLPLRILKHRAIYRNRILLSIESILDKEKYSFKKELNSITHLCASHYAYDFVSQRSNRNVFLCIEPISQIFLNQYFAEKKNIVKENRKNVVLYNPLRHYSDIVEKLKKLLPQVIFEPLLGLNQRQLIEKYETSKLYIDFGAFPGAERIPKEAVLFGCAIITGRLGASNYYGDVPIPDCYKYENPKKNIEKIAEKIQYINENYCMVYSDFDEYRRTILNLEENFLKSLKEVFLCKNP